MVDGMFEQKNNIGILESTMYNNSNKRYIYYKYFRNLIICYNKGLVKIREIEIWSSLTLHEAVLLATYQALVAPFDAHINTYLLCVYF